MIYTDFSSRALHSAGLAVAGACGFIASATLPPHAYKVRKKLILSSKYFRLTYGPLY
jgi:hypothetical protein